MTAKAWYWTGLGLLILSIGSSGTGRCWMEKASGVMDELRAKTVPYMAMAEMATGHTQAGIGHMQAARAHFEEQQARLEAAQARIEAQRARLEALASQRQFSRMNVLANYPEMSNFDVEVPGVSVSQDGVVVRGHHGVTVCPRARVSVPNVEISIPDVQVSTPRVSVMQDPI
jgi:hypothetical protein